LNEVIERLPGGWSAEVGEGGALLSGGERQRFSIARALLKDAPIVLLGEVTSALDPVNEAAVHAGIEELMAGRTVVLVTHRMRIVAGADWEGEGYVFASPTGGPLSPNTDFHVWKRLLRDAGVRDGRLHDARHTAATVLLILGVPDVVIDSIMGWEPGGAARIRARYMHVTGTMLRKVAQQVGDALWEPPGTAGDSN
jgi:hypothetical protein